MSNAYIIAKVPVTPPTPYLEGEVAFNASAECSQARAAHQGAAVMRMVLVEGL